MISHCILFIRSKSLVIARSHVVGTAQDHEHQEVNHWHHLEVCLQPMAIMFLLEILRSFGPTILATVLLIGNGLLRLLVEVGESVPVYFLVPVFYPYPLVFQSKFQQAGLFLLKLSTSTHLVAKLFD